MKLSNKVYDILKWIAMYVLPGLGTLYFALAQIWGLPFGEQVVGTITALDTFLGVVLGVSAAKYEHDGTLKINTFDAKADRYFFEMNTPLEELGDKKTVSLKVEATKPSK